MIFGDLLSILGGTLGLFLGMSILSVFELMELFMHVVRTIGMKWTFEKTKRLAKKQQKALMQQKTN